MSSIGETLRRERLRRNLDLDQISQELRISSRFLEAIEDERFDKLPAGVFVKSFVRQYARLLDLDEEELAYEVQRALEPLPIEAAAHSAAAPPDIHVPRVEAWQTVGGRRFDWSSTLPALALVVVVMLVCSGVYAFWQRARHPVTVQTAPPPLAAVTQTPKETAPQPPQTSPAAPAPAPAQPAAQAPTAVSNPAAPIQSADRPVPEPGTPKQEPVRPSNPNAPVRVEMTAEEPVWVLARADGKYLFSGTLEANQTRAVEANGTLLLRLGNAGGVNIILNGKPIGAVGPKGQVRDVQFTSGGFQVVAAPKPSVPNPI